MLRYGRFIDNLDIHQRHAWPMYSNAPATVTHNTVRYSTTSRNTIQNARSLVERHYGSSSPSAMTALTLITRSMPTLCTLTTLQYYILWTRPHDSRQRDGYRTRQPNTSGTHSACAGSTAIQARLTSSLTTLAQTSPLRNSNKQRNLWPFAQRKSWWRQRLNEHS